MRWPYLALTTVLATFLVCPAPLQAQTIIDEWQNVKAPPAPELSSVTVDPNTTALLVLDLIDPNCTRRPRCLASIPAMKQLINAARAKGVTVVYSLAGQATAADILQRISLQPLGEVVIKSSVDKFSRNRFGKVAQGKRYPQRDRDWHSQLAGAVLYTGSAAAMKGMNVIVPVDGMSSEDLFYEQATAWLLAKGTGGIGPKVTLTKIDLLKF